jgi:uncharacterized Fe-S center protein
MGKSDRMNKIIYFTHINQLPKALTHFKIEEFANKKIPLKLHMGEKNNQYFPPSTEVQHAIDALKKHHAHPFLYDTTVAYSGLRHNKDTYKKLAETHGFSQQSTGCPIIIDDSGQDIQIQGRQYTVANQLIQATHIFAWSHVKGHIATGMGGAIKNFGMGGVTKETKLDMHHKSRPLFHKDNCTYCSICAESCPFEALTVTNESWIKNNKACFGCGVCVDVCPSDALTNIDANLQYLIACAAQACVKDKTVLYLNDVNRIARSCDCDPSAGPILAPDIGYLLSNDPVAIDKASLDLIHKKHPNLFKEKLLINPEKQITFGEQIGLGSSTYELIKI